MRPALILLLIVDTAMIQGPQPPAVVTVPNTPVLPPEPPPAVPEVDSEPEVEPEPPPKPTIPSQHHIAFTYRSRRAKEVWLVGSFNGWKKGVDPFVVGRDGVTWTCVKTLKDGTYRYAFWVDGQVIRDPNNRRREGRYSVLVLPKPSSP